MPRENFDLFCPSCNILVEAKVIAHGFGGSRAEPISPFEEMDAEYNCDYYSVALCRRCDGPFLVREALYGVPGEFETVTDEIVLFPVPAELKLQGLPESVARSMAQAHRSFSTSSYDACAVMCRRALEALCDALSANGRNLARRLTDLEANAHIDARLLEWAHGVRLVGNEGAHDVETPVSPDDARDILEFTEALLMYVFTLNAKFTSFKSRRKRTAVIAPLSLHSTNDEPVSGSPRGDSSGAGPHSPHPRRAVSRDDLDMLLGPGNYSDIAREADPPLSVSHVSRVLRGLATRPSHDVVQRIAKAVGVSIDDLQAYLVRRRSSPSRSTRRQSSKPVANRRAKLDIDKAREIRVRVDAGESRADLAEEFGVTKQAISDVIRRISYPPNR